MAERRLSELRRLHAKFPLLALPLAMTCLNTTSVQAGSLSTESSRGQQEALENARQRMPPGAVETRYECHDVVDPMVKTLHRCTIYWDEPQPPSARP
jgi:hypothetical protein